MHFRFFIRKIDDATLSNYLYYGDGAYNIGTELDAEHSESSFTEYHEAELFLKNMLDDYDTNEKLCMSMYQIIKVYHR